MSQRKWYKKKRIWFLIVLVTLFLVTKMEWAKFRYDKTLIIEQTILKGQKPPIFDTRQGDGKTINFLSVGNFETLPIIVFVHGSPGALNAYEDYFSDTLLSNYADMIAVDRLGFGYSDFGESVSSLALQAKLIAKILEGFPNQKKILVGHSMGGPVISKLGMDYPELVDGMLMVAPSISPELEPSNSWRKALDFPLIRWLTPSALRVCNQEIIPLKEELDQMMTGWRNIAALVVVVQGMEDSLVPKGNADFAKKMVKNKTKVKTVMIEGGDHFVLWSEIPLIKKELFGLLERLEELN